MRRSSPRAPDRSAIFEISLFFRASNCASLVGANFVFQNLNTWQLVINTATTIVTFLLVALLQNSQRRTEEAVNQKLDALADGLADLMDHLGKDDPELRKDMQDLRSAVGAEHIAPHKTARHGNGHPGRSAVGDSLSSAGR